MNEELEELETMKESLQATLAIEQSKTTQLNERIHTLETTKPSFKHWSLTGRYHLDQSIHAGLGYHLPLGPLDLGILADIQVTPWQFNPGIGVQVRL